MLPTLSDIALFLQTMGPWHWLILGVSLIFSDVLLGGSFYLLWFGLSASVLSVFCWNWPTWSPTLQGVLFILMSGVGVFVQHRLTTIQLNKKKSRHSRSPFYPDWDQDDSDC